ncbi:uncharacterized protein EI97DRAFT_432378 [Westerdykella ornata]|uniref:Uncharacterized protein n=1 Tax=Westerdykella ornata TaxID=318751 RepID=A0A6A6JMQ6_WESOR|nr:uncharacterized protein EI97DRAFT_432378 [Westerdykella ornata]KAF2277514.1 hypothetical protein EI97DRAFT_432378 [Westerdykella ornata]
MGSGQSTVSQAPTPAVGAQAPPSNAVQPAKPKPCCVCLDEKAERDKCMLFSNSDDAQKECADLVQKYKTCMAGYGFQVN